MKKYIKFILLIMVATILSGCGKKLDTIECGFESNQSDYKIKTNYKIYYRDKIVEKVDIDEVIISSNKDKIEEFNKSFKNQYDSNNSMYGGYIYDIKANKDKLELSVNIDYTSFNMKKFVSDNPAMKEYVNKDNKLTLDGIINMYEASGSTCNKNE